MSGIDTIAPVCTGTENPPALTDEVAGLGPPGEGPFDRRRCTTCGIQVFGVDLHGVTIRTLDGANDTWALIDERTHSAVGAAS